MVKLGFCVLGRKTREAKCHSHHIISRDILTIFKISAVSIILSLFPSLILVVISLIFFTDSFYRIFLRVGFFFFCLFKELTLRVPSTVYLFYSFSYFGV